MDKKYVITIGRQLGSGGRYLGEQLSEKLGIPCYDKELIQLASRESGLGKEFFERADEQSKHGFFNTFFGFRSGYMGDVTGNYLSNEILFKIQSDVIKNLAEKESCIFVGRCADYILREHTKLLSIFVSAEIDDRIRIISENNKIPPENAKILIEQTDKKRAGYYNYFSNKTWGMATSYKLCFNSSFISIQDMISFIEERIKKDQL
ncbi:MAG: cytidylate kinase-like family protein [Dysgonamonadaceae bacterium]|jgi:cytidylate kinase|nr:cytidylate kinase-like family protein [Dysgonamonadaceae bacterium]